MKRELKYFEIEKQFGGNQDWFTNVVMHMGGCAAATACDSCIYLAREKGLLELYPYDARRLTKQDYKSFSMRMKPYLKPRKGGVDKLCLYTEGFGNYLSQLGGKDGKRLSMETLEGYEPYEKARKAVKSRIDAALPVPYLLLRHQETELFRDFIWHWFLLVGYEETEEEFWVTTATYGQARKFPLRKMWETGCEPKGGMILYRID